MSRFGLRSSASRHASPPTEGSSPSCSEAASSRLRVSARRFSIRPDCQGAADHPFSRYGLRRTRRDFRNSRKATLFAQRDRGSTRTRTRRWPGRRHVSHPGADENHPSSLVGEGGRRPDEGRSASHATSGPPRRLGRDPARMRRRVSRAGSRPSLRGLEIRRPWVAPPSSAPPGHLLPRGEKVGSLLALPCFRRSTTTAAGRGRAGPVAIPPSRDSGLPKSRGRIVSRPTSAGAG